MKFLTKLFGSHNDRLLKQYRKTVDAINAQESTLSALSDIDLQQKTNVFKERLQRGEQLDSILVEAFAVCREASKRVLGMRHFDVQVLGGLALHNGKIAEMSTGEGKTLTATLPIYLNALNGNGVHVVTVNDYLAGRDAEQMGALYSWLGLSVGLNLSGMSVSEKQSAYRADITYGTSNEFGFDYLRDNMVYSIAERVQRGLTYSIVDEVDSILIDEARTPLIISGESDSDVAMFKKVNIVPSMLTLATTSDESGDYTVDEKNQQVLLTEKGHLQVEKILKNIGLIEVGSSLYDPANISLLHHINAALKAHALFQKDKHYVVLGEDVVVVDEFTGRMMPGRRWADGLHQAVEAKEGLTVHKDSQTLATITFQNYFRLYKKLCGMTGTADTEAYEFQNIYGLETVVIPPNRKCVRVDHSDKIFATLKEKYSAIVADVKECYLRGQPVLVGTTSIESSELLSSILKKEKLPHNVLNAKNHEREAEIIAQAGSIKAITIATNMAGRGTDIILGGNSQKDLLTLENKTNLSDESKQNEIKKLQEKYTSLHEQVKELGGLHIIGTERHESRRIDNQLRGRSGRQGDQGSSCFYLSFEDPLLRIFAGDKLRSLLEKFKFPEGRAIESSMVTGAIESAQRKVEAHHFEIRKQLLEYDDIANDQRLVMYAQRAELLESSEGVLSPVLRTTVLTRIFRQYVPEDTLEEQWDLSGLANTLRLDWRVSFDVGAILATENDTDDQDLLQRVLTACDSEYLAKAEVVGKEIFAHYERLVMLQCIDTHWREHLSSLDELREGIHLRGYAQKNPQQEYKREAFEMFGKMLDSIMYEVVKTVFLTKTESKENINKVTGEMSKTPVNNISYAHAEYTQDLSENDDFVSPAVSPTPVKRKPIVNAAPRVGRNDACPCGSTKKYKHCHGKNA